ncbi:MAG: glycosyl transferase family 1, partial [Acidimicrobiales bacterium]
MTAVHQLVAHFVPRDAQSAQVVHTRRVLRSMGLASDVYAEVVEGGLAVPARHYLDYPAATAAGDTWLLYHFSTASPIAAWLAARPEGKLICYHNVTPAELLSPWDAGVGLEVAAARRQLAALAPVTDLAIAVSRFNEAELRQAGFART